MSDTAILNVRILSGAGVPRPESWDIFVRDDVITDVSPSGTRQPRPGSRILDGQNGFALPGLVNAHTHSPENLGRGLATTSRLQDWLTAVWRRLDHLSPDAIRLAVRIGAVEMIRSGVCAVIDHFRQTPMTEAAIHAVIDAYAEIGLEAVIPIMLRDGRTGSGLTGAPHVDAAPSAQAQLDLVQSLSAYGREKGVVLGLGPSAPHRCTDAMLGLLTELSHGGEFLIHMHVDETAEDAAASRERFGVSTVTHLGRLNLLGPRTSLAHCVWLDDGDATLLADTGTVVVHNPVSNLRLGSGRCDLPGLIAAGVTIALGTDGAGSNDGQNSWEAMKLAALLPRLELSPEAWPSSSEILQMGIDGGWIAMGQATPELQPRAKASFAIFDEELMPGATPADALVLGSTRRSARHVLSCGRVLLRDHMFTTIDEGALREELRQREWETAA